METQFKDVAHLYLGCEIETDIAFSISNHSPVGFAIRTNEYIPTIGYKTYQVDPKSIGQLTGVLAEGGKEVFEGDIVVDKATGDKWVIFFEQNHGYTGWCCKLIGRKTTAPYRTSSSSNGSIWKPLNTKVVFQIIGNKIDNPELLIKL